MGTRWNRLADAVLTGTHNLCFEQKYEKYVVFFFFFFFFLSEHFQFLEVKFSIYLNRRVFVMCELFLLTGKYICRRYLLVSPRRGNSNVPTRYVLVQIHVYSKRPKLSFQLAYLP